MVADLNALLPAVFAAFLDAMKVGLQRQSTVATPNTRMADFAKFVVAAEPALPWEPGESLGAYRNNQGAWTCRSHRRRSLAKLVTSFAEGHSGLWSGLVSELYERLSRRFRLKRDAREAGPVTPMVLRSPQASGTRASRTRGWSPRQAKR